MPTHSSGRRRKSKRLSSALLFARDAGVALLLVVLILLMMYGYTGLWPPLVVVESNSMMHGDENISHIGTIDTGDLVLVRKTTRASEIATYMDGIVSGYRSYGDYGDVVIYKPGGTDARTPIIHRAIIYLQFDPANNCYRSASLSGAPSDKWVATDQDDTWDRLTSVLRIFHVGWNDLTVVIDVAGLIPTQKDGFITKGDRNVNTDQMLASGGLVEVEWIVGKARGEIPWFGLLKLWTTDSLGSAAPENSVRNLWVSMILIVITPVVIDIGLTYKEKRAISKRISKKSDSDTPYYKTVRQEEMRVEAEPSAGETEEPPKQPT